ncbi:MAG: response regulator [Marinilabiliaceae bacterium]|nr:response regulator [Marinilabiliaceae bacterium]
MSDKTKILYVDDEEINLQLFEINFQKKYQVITALDGLKGLELLEANPEILIVISDMRMPKMNGIEFIKQAKERFPDKRFFILTGFEITEEIQSALESGLILRYFKKPFNIKEIDSALVQVIDMK